jgi:hypothetical protein
VLPPEERRPVLSGLWSRAKRLVVIEFDVPDLARKSNDHLRFLVDRYEAGLAEYADDPLVADGFLLPVLIGQVAPDAPRATWEQPAARWADELESAGFRITHRETLHHYWWAPACAIHAAATAAARRAEAGGPTGPAVRPA